MAKGYFERVQSETLTRFWINNVTRAQAQLAIDNGAVGCTQNPAYTWKMIQSVDEKEYVDGIINAIIAEEKDDNMALVKLQRELIGGVAKVFYPMFEASSKKNGYVSIQGDPFDETYDSIVKYGLFNREAGENIMCKVPVVPEGLKGIEALIKQYTPINATEIMALRQAMDVCDLYDKTTKNMVNPAPLYYSVITGIFDEQLKADVEADKIDISPDKCWIAGLAVAKKIYEMVKKRGYDCHFIGGGARGLHHFTEMVGANASITINWKGTADKLLEQNAVVVDRFCAPTPLSVIDELTEKIDVYRKAYYINAIDPSEYEDYGPVVLFRSSFEEAWGNALKLIADMRKNG